MFIIPYVFYIFITYIVIILVYSINFIKIDFVCLHISFNTYIQIRDLLLVLPRSEDPIFLPGSGSVKNTDPDPTLIRNEEKKSINILGR